MRALQKITALALLPILVTLTQSPFSRADEPTTPELIKIAGQPVLLKYQDGREAIMKVTAIQLENVAIPFAITENTCNDKVATGCKYYTPSTYSTFFFAWSKHSDPSKINQQLVSGSENDNGSDRKINFTTSYSTLNRSQFPNANILKSMPNQYIVCPNLDWFEPNDPLNENARRVRAISTELALQNNETGVNENRFFATIRDVILKKVSKTRLEIESAFLPKSIALNIPLLFFGDAAWYVKLNSGDVCQFTSRAQFADAVADYNAAASNMTKPEDEKHVYVYGDADADNLNRIDYNLEKIIRRTAKVQ